MRRINIWMLSTMCGLVLLVSYRTSTMGAGGGTNAAQDTTADGDGERADPTGGGGTITPGTSPPGTSPPGTSPPGTAPGTRGADATAPDGTATGTETVNGTVARTRWGPVQVQITTSGGKITDVTAIQVPTGTFRDLQINEYALPILREEALRAQSARIETVSGATVTSDGYRESLQAAIDAARLQ